jgi:hypothetical protein
MTGGRGLPAYSGGLNSSVPQSAPLIGQAINNFGDGVFAQANVPRERPHTSKEKLVKFLNVLRIFCPLMDLKIKTASTTR